MFLVRSHFLSSPLITSVYSGNNNRMKILLSKIIYERNLSVRQLSIISGVSKSTIHEDMKEDSNPKIKTLEQLAIGLNCRITDLFDSDVK